MQSLTKKCVRICVKQWRRPCNDHSPVIITRPYPPPLVLMISLDDYNSWSETEYLTRSPANAKDLQEAVEDIKNRRNLVNRELIE